MTQLPSICIVAHNAYGVLAGVDTGHAGGVEVQLPLMARALARHGFAVSMITWDEGYVDGAVIDGVTVYKLCRKDAGLPILRFFTPRWSSLDAALSRADADIVYYNRGDMELGQVALWTRRRGRRLMYSVASDIDCTAGLADKSLRERILYRYGLLRADRIVVQTRNQQQMLKGDYALDSHVISMPSEGFPNLARAPVDRTRAHLRVLWVGRLSEEKRFEWLLDMAEARTDCLFDVLGDANQGSAYADALVERAAALPNVTMHGRVAHAEMGAYYAAADVLCSTSIWEGFPNVYLEAWSIGIPLVSTFDPDGVVQRHGLGRLASDVPGLLAALADLEDPNAWNTASRAAREYFNDHHSIDTILDAFAAEFQGLAGASR